MAEVIKYGKDIVLLGERVEALMVAPFEWAQLRPGRGAEAVTVPGMDTV
jgi:hypothetical protein